MSSFIDTLIDTWTATLSSCYIREKGTAAVAKTPAIRKVQGKQSERCQAQLKASVKERIGNVRKPGRVEERTGAEAEKPGVKDGLL